MSKFYVPYLVTQEEEAVVFRFLLLVRISILLPFFLCLAVVVMVMQSFPVNHELHLTFIQKFSSNSNRIGDIVT
jgi:hypothetical protein